MYLITFHSNYDANLLQKNLKNFGELKRKPVPRELSSSCGTCIVITPNENFSLELLRNQYFEAIYLIENGTYIKIDERD